MGDLTEMSVDSVRVHSPSGHHVVVLKELKGERYLAISIGNVEANSIALNLAGLAAERPLTHDLVVDIFSVAEMDLKRVLINSPGNEVYHARLVGEMRGRKFEIDARASDAIALAVRSAARIFVVTAVLARAALDRPDGGPPEGGDDSKPSVFQDLINSMDLPALGSSEAGEEV
jgi:bifunctional DNase/RNase